MSVKKLQKLLSHDVAYADHQKLRMIYANALSGHYTNPADNTSCIRVRSRAGTAYFVWAYKSRGRLKLDIEGSDNRLGDKGRAYRASQLSRSPS
jgi:hypothetical protein